MSADSLPLLPLFGESLDGLRRIAAEAGLRPFAGRQMADWLYRKGAESIGAMSNLPAAARAALEARYEIGRRPPLRAETSADGTKKYLFPTAAGDGVETAWIPDRERATLCVSTQAGCRMGCRFCMTARQGFQGHLTAGEMVNQYASLPERETVTNLVYMGMGEPLDNLEPVLASLEILTADWGYAMSPRRITVSTVGVLPALGEFLRRSRCHLAVSVHSPFDDERAQWMPIQRTWPLSEVLAELRRHPMERQRRIFFEYLCFDGLNDTARHARGLARALNGLRGVRVNLMRYHPTPGLDARGSGEERLAAFQQALRDKGILAIIRRSRGLDISAACGLLSTRARDEQKPVLSEQ